MSTIVMSKCWPLQGMSPAQKAVLISLADMANDEGVCWPSVALIASRTCLSDRAVQKAIKWLEEAGVVVATERSGRSTFFHITPEQYSPPNDVHPRTQFANPRTTFTPPPNVVHPTPERSSPRTVKEPLKNRKEPSGAKNPAPISPPSGVSDSVWADFVRYRKAKRADVTQTVVNVIERELEKAEKKGWDRDMALAETMAAGWQGVKADWLEKRCRPQDANGQTKPRGLVL